MLLSSSTENIFWPKRVRKTTTSSSPNKMDLKNIKLEEHFDANGKKASPLLPEHIKNYLIDIDGTICEDVPNEEPERMLTCEVIHGAVDHVNKWYDEGHIITFFTSRLEEHRAYTETWLTKHGF